MSNMVLEVKATDIKKIKAKELFRLKKFQKLAFIAIGFVLVMIFIRAYTLWTLSAENAESFKEIFTKRYYYGNESIGLIKYMTGAQADALAPQFVWRMAENGGIQEILAAIGIGIPIIAYSFLAVPFMYLNMKFISVMDAIVPKTGNVIIWWFIYLFIFAFIYLSIVNIRIMKRNVVSKDSVNKELGKINKFIPVIGFIIVTFTFSFVSVNHIAGTEINENPNAVNIKELVNAE